MQKKIKMSFIVSFFASSIIGFILIYLPIVPSPAKKQYTLTPDKTFQKVKNIAPTGKSKNQTLVETIGDKMSKKMQPTVFEDEFARWAILDNSIAGYKLIYPYGFNIEYDATKIELKPPTGAGKITININGNSYQINVDESGADSEQIKLLQAAKRLISESFEFKK